MTDGVNNVNTGPDGKSAVLAARVPKDTKDGLKAIARQRGISVSRLVREMAEDMLKQAA